MSRDFETEIVGVYFALIPIARRLCPEEGADLASEAVTRALEHRDSYDPSRSLFVWCRAILRNLCINHEQRAGTRRTARIGMRDAVAYTESDQAAIMGDLTAVIEKLRGESVSVATLLDFAEGYSLAEIASIRSLPLGTVKRRIHDGRAMLSKALPV